MVRRAHKSPNGRIHAVRGVRIIKLFHISAEHVDKHCLSCNVKRVSAFEPVTHNALMDGFRMSHGVTVVVVTA